MFTPFDALRGASHAASVASNVASTGRDVAWTANHVSAISSRSKNDKLREQEFNARTSPPVSMNQVGMQPPPNQFQPPPPQQQQQLQYYPQPIQGNPQATGGPMNYPSHPGMQQERAASTGMLARQPNTTLRSSGSKKGAVTDAKSAKQIKKMLDAAKNNRTKDIEKLLQKNPRIVAGLDDKGNSIAHYAVSNSNVALLQFILSLEPRLCNIENIKGFTPAHLALNRQDSISFSALVSTGVLDLHMPHRCGKNILAALSSSACASDFSYLLPLRQNTNSSNSLPAAPPKDLAADAQTNAALSSGGLPQISKNPVVENPANVAAFIPSQSVGTAITDEKLPDCPSSDSSSNGFATAADINNGIGGNTGSAASSGAASLPGLLNATSYSIESLREENLRLCEKVAKLQIQLDEAVNQLKFSAAAESVKVEASEKVEEVPPQVPDADAPPPVLCASDNVDAHLLKVLVPYKSEEWAVSTAETLRQIGFEQLGDLLTELTEDDLKAVGMSPVNIRVLTKALKNLSQPE